MEQIFCRKGRKVWLRVVFFVFFIGFLGSGCASYTMQTQKVSQSYDLGNFQAAATQITQEADKRGNSKDAIVWRLEQGAVLRAAGRFAESNQAFDKAEVSINKYEEQAKIKVGREALASVTNLTTLPYEGFAYDKIMMNTYKALNYLQMGDYEKARVEFNRAYQRQDDAVQINSARIEKAQEEGNKQNLNIDLDRINSDQKFKRQFDNYYSDLGLFKAYAVYVNPLTVYLDGMYFMTNATGGSDFERAQKSFERVLGMIGENQYIRQDMETIQQVINGKPIPATTYVFFETGEAPEREQIRIDLPLFLVVPGVPYMGAAFPRLKYNSNYLSAFNISHDGKTEAAFLLSNMDAVIAQEFKNELPTIITKTIIASVIKAGVTYGTYAGVTNGGRKNTGAGLAVLLAGAIYQAATNQADLRTWTTLPKEFQFCRFLTPADRKIELEPPFSGYKLPVNINDGLINVVWVKSINRGSPLLVSQFKLKEEIKDTAIESPQEPIKPEQPPQSQQPETSKPEQAVQPSQSGTTDQVQPIQGTQTESSKSEQSAPSSQSESSIPVQSTQNQSAHESDVPKPAESTQSENIQSSNKQELPLDTALRFERERIQRMYHGNKKQQINLLQVDGYEAFKKRDWNTALDALKKKLEIDPENYSAYTNIGGIYARLSEFDKSLQYLSKAKQLIPAAPAPYVFMVYVYAKKGDKDCAFDSLQKAIDRGFCKTNSLINDPYKQSQDSYIIPITWEVNDINQLRNDTDLPEDFRNDPRLTNFVR